MNPVLLYMVKAALSLTALYFVYLLFLGRDTLYERNRYFILFSACASLVFPLIVIQTRQPIDLQFFGKDFTEVLINNNPDMLVNPADAKSSENLSTIFLYIYLAGVLFFGTRMVAEFFLLFYLIVRQKNRTDKIIRLKNPRTAGFSAFGFIFIDSRLNKDVADDIIRHEQNHLKYWHFIDILLIEIFKIMQWFNPFIYLFDKSLREVHEFQADKECLNSGITISRYQGLLLNQVFRTNIFSAADSFSNPTIIRKRMIMMTRERTSSASNLKMLLTLPVVTFLLISFSTYSDESLLTSGLVPAFTLESYTILPPPPLTTGNTVNNQVTNTIPSVITPAAKREPYVVVDHMPVFPGGDKALLQYISENTRYPEKALSENISGRVIVRFCVSEKGNVEAVTVLKGVEQTLDGEAVRVVSSLPAFEPGRQNDIPVPVWYMVPVTFSHNQEEPSPVSISPSVQQTASLPENEQGRTIAAEKHEDPVIMNETPAMVAEQMPRFPGGDKELLKYVARNTRYPSLAKENKITGKVVVRFCVSESGNVDQVSVLKGVDPTLDAEAVRVVSGLPDFEPGRQGGREVPVWYSVPITFALRE